MVDARIRQIFASLLSPQVADELTIQSSMETVEGWDSQSFVSIIVAIEAEFGITLAALDAVRMSSVGAIQDVLVEKGVLART
jgi:acyl carrier protein